MLMYLGQYFALPQWPRADGVVSQRHGLSLFDGHIRSSNDRTELSNMPFRRRGQVCHLKLWGAEMEIGYLSQRVYRLFNSEVRHREEQDAAE